MKLSRGKRLHLLWLLSPQGRKYGSLPALRTFVRTNLLALTERELQQFKKGARFPSAEYPRQEWT